jgi:hypothetical protein
MKKMYLTLSLLMLLFGFTSFAQVQVSPRLADALAKKRLNRIYKNIGFSC